MPLPFLKSKDKQSSDTVPAKLSKSHSGDKNKMGNLYSRFCRGDKHSDGMVLSQHRQKECPEPPWEKQQSQSQSLWSPPPYSPEPPRYSPDSIIRPSTRRTLAYTSASESPYAFLGDFDTVFLVDDSSSMLGQLWKEAEEAIATIAPICTMYDRDGIDIYFLNHRCESSEDISGGYTNVTTADAVEKIFNSVKPRGTTPVGRRLLQILTPYLRRVETMAAATNVDGILIDPTLFVKPLNIIAITDGAFTDDAEGIIIDAATRLDSYRARPWQVGIQFFQIGTDESAAQYLQELDDELGKTARNERFRDIVDTVPWRGQKGQKLNAQGIMKCVLGAVHKKYDRRDAFC